MLTIGLTGGYATGKSTVGGMLRSLGAVVVDADELAHAVIRRGEPGWSEVVGIFGPAILAGDREIDRAALGRLVFSQPALRDKLERIVHPRAIAAVHASRDEAEAAGAAVFVCEAPLLFEAGLADEFDLVWVVSSGTAAQAVRSAARDGLSVEELNSRTAAQMPLAEKEDRADLVLQNDGDLAALQRRVAAAWRGLARRSVPPPSADGK